MIYFVGIELESQFAPRDDQRRQTNLVSVAEQLN
jgi:hypothetical protein